MSRVKKLILLEMILAIMESAFLYFALTDVQSSHDGYTELTIKFGSSASYTFHNTTVRFWYGSFPFPIIPGGNEPNLVLTSDNGTPYQGGIGWYAIKGETDQMGDLEIRVLELNSDHIVILVKPVS